jgi:hypothetical protein
MIEDINDRLTRLLRGLQLQEIRPMFLQSESLGQMPPPGNELQLEWKQMYANDDPLVPSPEARLFRPRYELTVSFQGAVFFKQVSTFVVAFKVLDTSVFEELWADVELRKVFLEKQIQKTLWPLFRQHAHDGMSRLGMSPVPLPWLL